MTSAASDVLVMVASLLVSVFAYVWVSRHEHSYFNIMTPSFLINIPAYYFLPLIFMQLFGAEASFYAHAYVYSTLAVQNLAFAYVYTRPGGRTIRLPLRFAYRNFGRFAYLSTALAVLMYLPVLLEFPEYILDPRQIYIHTRTGFGVNFYISSTLAYLAVVLVQFSTQSKFSKAFVIAVCAAVLSLHGSKGQMVTLAMLILLYHAYARGWKIRLLPSLVVGGAMSSLLLLLFAATMALGDSPGDALQTISEYSDYTRNAMLVIDSPMPLQYGRLTLEGHLFGRVPRVLMPNKPKNFGALYLADEFFPESIDADAGAPDFGIGVQYADFGVLAIVFLAGFAMLRAWLARSFVRRLRLTHHPADFFMLAFFADLSLFPVGAVGWLLPEAFLVAMALRSASSLGAKDRFVEKIKYRPGLAEARQS